MTDTDINGDFYSSLQPISPLGGVSARIQKIYLKAHYFQQYAKHLYIFAICP